MTAICLVVFVSQPEPRADIASPFRCRQPCEDDEHEMASEDSHSLLLMSVKFLNILILPLALFQIKIIPSPSPFIFFTQPYLSWGACTEFYRFFKFMF